MKLQWKTPSDEHMAQAAVNDDAAGNDESPDTGGALPTRDPMKYSGEIERRIGERLDLILEWTGKLPVALDRSAIELFWRVDAQRTDRSPYVLQFVAATRGSGTSTVASDFAIVAAVAMHRPVLLLNALASPQPARPSILRALADRRGLHEAIGAIPGVPALYQASLADDFMMLARTAGDLKGLLDLMQERFSAVLIDSPAIQDSEVSLMLSRHCDTTALVVRAEHSPRAAVRNAVTEIERHGGNVLGTVLNRQKRHLPAWLDRRLD